jgi:hypothetical protein
MFSSSIIDDSKSIIDDSRTIIDYSRSIIDDSKSDTPTCGIIYDHFIIKVEATAHF